MTYNRVAAGAGALAALCAGMALAACGASVKNVTVTNTSGQQMMTMANGQVMPVSGMSDRGSKTAGSSSKSGMSSMSGMQVNTGVPAVNGVKPVASQVLANADWQGMKIQARTMTPIRFYVYNGTSERLIKPAKNASFHLMVMLNDVHTNEPIPYATVWATIRDSAGKVVYDDRQWPMISAFMGPHYGNDVSLPGAGRYTLTLLVSPPVAARHVEYKNVWLRPHRVVEHFTWNGKS